MLLKDLWIQFKIIVSISILQDLVEEGGEGFEPPYADLQSAT